MPHEIDRVVATEKCFAVCNPCISGAHRFFGRAKQVYFSIPGDQRESMQDAKSFVQFWQRIVCNQAMPGPMQHYAVAVLLACAAILSLFSSAHQHSTLNTQGGGGGWGGVPLWYTLVPRRYQCKGKEQRWDKTLQTNLVHATTPGEGAPGPVLVCDPPPPPPLLEC